ncbi:Ig-like domain-containing protein [Teichococcus aestuarii]|uniref:Ig-like domain-containing protein n=2 Tax=Teichococcus aestuarii TaxID=568898 RepID=UPI003615EDF8
MAAPANNDIINAIAINPGANLVGTTVEASAQEGESNYFGGTSSVWYSFTPAENGAVAFSFGPGSAAESLIIWSAPAGTAPSIASLGGVTNNGGSASSVQFFARADQTYYLQVGSIPGTEGEFTLASVPPDPAIDVTPPDAPVIGAITDLQNNPVADTVTVDTLVFTGTAEPGATVTLRQNFGGQDTNAGTEVAANDGTWRIEVPGLVAGDYLFGAVAADAAGNASLTASQIFDFTVTPTDQTDTTPPDAPVIVAIANSEGAVADGVSALPVLTLSGTAEANSTITVFNGNETVGTPVTADAEGNWTFTTPSLPEASYSFTATATDAAGNISTTSPTPAVVEIDLPAGGTLEAPAALALDPGSDSGTVGNGMTTDATPTITGTAADGLTVTLYNGETVLGSAVAEGGTWTITPEQALAAGTYQLTAIASDAEGNASDLSDPLALTINAFRDPAGFPSSAPAFDAQYYLAMNPDVAAAGADPLAHYMEFGWHEGRDPNALFDVAYYLNQNQDVAAAGIDPLAHYTEFGWREGREPSYAFSGDLYLQNNTDVAEAGLNPLVHYLYFGMAEERAAFQSTPEVTGPQNPLVDAQFYFENNPDVAASGIDPSRHFAEFGWEEGRDPNAFFDVDYYLATYSDVAEAGLDPLQHYLEFGAREQRDPSAAFSTSGYLAANDDVAADGINPLQHYLQFGIAEGRLPVPVTVLEPVPDLV